MRYVVMAHIKNGDNVSGSSFWVDRLVVADSAPQAAAKVHHEGIKNRNPAMPIRVYEVSTEYAAFNIRDSVEIEPVEIAP